MESKQIDQTSAPRDDGAAESAGKGDPITEILNRGRADVARRAAAKPRKNLTRAQAKALREVLDLGDLTALHDMTFEHLPWPRGSPEFEAFEKRHRDRFLNWFASWIEGPLLSAFFDREAQ